jgi:ribosomal protein L31
MLRCPRDAQMLVQYTYENKSLWRCDVCSGALVYSESVASNHLHPITRRAQWDREIQCPSDSTKMHGFRYRNVTLDVCFSCHGVWLDGDEIKKILGHAVPGDSIYDPAKILIGIMVFVGEVIGLALRFLPK